jgi:hypothetical protein
MAFGQAEEAEGADFHEHSSLIHFPSGFGDLSGLQLDNKLGTGPRDNKLGAGPLKQPRGAVRSVTTDITGFRG